MANGKWEIQDEDPPLLGPWRAGEEETKRKTKWRLLDPPERIAAAGRVGGGGGYDWCTRKFEGGGCGKLEFGIGLEAKVESKLWRVDVEGGGRGEGSLSAELCVKGTSGGAIEITADFCGSFSAKIWAKAKFWGGGWEMSDEAKQSLCTGALKIASL